MRKNKTILKIIIILIVILVIGIAGFAYAYFFTDVLKTDKQKFFKYISQNAEVVSSVESKELSEYLKKKKTTPYETSGKFYTEIDDELLEESIDNEKLINEVKEFEITLDGKKDAQNNYSYNNIKLEYSNGEAMIFEYLNEGDYYAIKVDGILKKFLAIENNNLKDLAEKLGVEDTSNIPNKIEVANLEKYKFTEEEMATIKDKIYSILDTNLTDNMFSEEKQDLYTKQTLKLTYGQAENILEQMFNTLINDETIQNKLKQIFIEELGMTEAQAQEQIEELKETTNDTKEELKDEASEDEESSSDILTISVYQSKGVLLKTEISTDESKTTFNIEENKLSLDFEEAEEDGESIVYNPAGELYIEKTQESDKIKYILNFSKDEQNITFEADYTGFQNSEKVDEKYSLELQYKFDESEDKADSIKSKYIYENNVTFNQSLEKENITSSDLVILNEYDSEKLVSTVQKLGEMILKLNKKQMNELGLEEHENPVLYSTPFLSNFMFMANNIKNDTEDAIDSSNLAEQELAAFNNKFASYEGSSVVGSQVKSLISTITLNNSSNDDKVQIIFNGEEYDIGDESTVSNKIETGKKYKILLYYENGKVNQIKIQENT